VSNGIRGQVYNRGMSKLKVTVRNAQFLIGGLRIVHSALCIVFLAACAASPTPLRTPEATSAATATGLAATPQATQVDPQATVVSTPQVLRLWLPPQFEPTTNTMGGRVLLAQLQAFEEAHSGWKVEVRIKKPSGQGGLLNALRASLQAAPGVSPDVIALDAPTLPAAVPFIQPLTDRLNESETKDLYPFALQSARVGDQVVGMPFAADVWGLAYSTSVYSTPPLKWSDINIAPGSLGLPLNDPLALVTLQNYAALGGRFTDEAGKPSIDPAQLAQVLTHYLFLQSTNTLSGLGISASSPAETWTAYREGRVTAVAVLSSNYLADRERLTHSAFTLAPTRDGQPYAFASQWSYALTASDPGRQEIALDLIRALTGPEALGEWTRAADMLPARPSALAVWPDTTLRAVFEDALLAAQPQPPPALLNTVGPPITAAVQVVLAGQASPEAAAETAAHTIAGR
jgi:ABC-type glycerol-3-phosphate transport system substrate-binding protein